MADPTPTSPAPAPAAPSPPPAPAAPPPPPSQGVSAPSPSAPTPDVSSAPSSSAETPGVDTREALLEAVQKAVYDREPGSQREGSGAASPAAAAQAGQTAQVPHLPDEVSREELNGYSPGARSRISQLVNERRALRADVAKLKALEPSAKAADSVSQYLRENDISKEDFLLGLDMMSTLRKGDFQRFYAGIRPYVNLAEEYLGISLPPDLQEQVRQGHMTTQAAQAFSRERMQRAMSQGNLRRQQQQFGEYAQAQQFQQQRAAREQLAERVRSTVNRWEAGVEQKDPDYAAKKTAVQDTMWAVVRQKGIPRSPQEAVQIAQEALRRVNANYQRMTPARRPTTRIPSSTGRTAGVTPEPRNLLEVVQQARLTAPRL